MEIITIVIVCDAQTHGYGRKRYTDYEVKMSTNLPVFRLKSSSVRRRYSDFEWLRGELERDSKVSNILEQFQLSNGYLQVVVPSLPGKAMTRLLPFRADDGIFDPGFIEDRRKGLEAFVNKELVLQNIGDHFESKNDCR